MGGIREMIAEAGMAAYRAECETGEPAPTETVDAATFYAMDRAIDMLCRELAAERAMHAKYKGRWAASEEYVEAQARTIADLRAALERKRACECE